MDRNIDGRVKALIAKLTLEEKIAQLGSCWIGELQTNGLLDRNKITDTMKNGIGQISRLAGASILDPCSAARAANELQKYLLEETRLGIPAIIHEECCCGAMVRGGTVFPQMIGLAATFQPELARTMADVIRAQLMAIGARQGLSPLLDVARDPRWGRIEETFGEDPTLVSSFGVAYIRGLQGEDLTNGVLATGKHFLGHSFSQGGLNCAPVHIGWREIYDVVLPPFQAAIRQAGLKSMMNAYPEVDGEVVAASRHILTEILREELGFDGVVVSDYEAVAMLHTYHFLAENRATAARLALEAGIDVELPTVECYNDPLREALETGKVSLETIDRAVSNHLRVKFELGLFENAYVDEGRVLEVYESSQNQSLAREIARQSMVLLKNDGCLPLNKAIKRIAVIGPNADDSRNQLADYSFQAMAELRALRNPDDLALQQFQQSRSGYNRIPTILDAIRSTVSAQTEVDYARGCGVMDDDSSGFDEAFRLASQADAVILVLGDRSGLTPECTTGETRDAAELHLPGVQEQLARRVIAAGKPVVVVLINGRPYAIPWLAENASAILEAWLPGEEGGAAVASVLFGDTNPGGKLPVSIPRTVGQLPVFYAAKPSGLSSFWYQSYVDEKTTPLYPFGHGLSYTTFEYSNLVIDRKTVNAGESVAVSLRLSNSGAVPGDEVVQLYIRDEYASIPRPSMELKGFLRVRLQPGETVQICFHLPVDQLAFHDQNLDLVLEPGRIIVMLGSSSEDIRLTGEFEITGAAKIPVAEPVFFCPVEII